MCKKIAGLLLAIVLLIGTVFSGIAVTVIDVQGVQYSDSRTTNTEAVKILVQPQNAAALDGGKAKVKVVATGDGLTYKWYFKNATSKTFALTTAYTTDTYSVSMNAARNGRQVYCVITDKYGNSVTTNTVTLSLTANRPPEITKQPQSVTVYDGKRATVSVAATGTGLTYKWYFRNSTSEDFALTTTYTTNTYSVPMTATRDGRQIYCVITDKYGNSVTTDIVTLSAKYAAKIVKQPTSVSALEGTRATVTFTATGDGLTYKWYYKNAGSTKFSLTTSFSSNKYYVDMTDARAGRQVYCVVTDKYGNSVTTDTVTLNMGKTVSITKQPVSVTVNENAKATVTVKAVGDGLTYQWYFKDAGKKEFSPTTSYKSNTYSVALTAARNGRLVYCVITDQYGNQVKTNVVALNMLHIHETGAWTTLRLPTPQTEGVERAFCSGCGYYQDRSTKKVTKYYTITIDLGNGETEKIAVGKNGAYYLSDPYRIGYNFKGFVNSKGKTFASSGKITASTKIYAKWEIDGTDTLEELVKRAGQGAKEILVTANITVNQPIYVPYETKIYSNGNFKLTRAPGYAGDIFVVGRNSKGESSVVNHHQACLTLGGGKGTLTVDGNCSKVTAKVNGSLIFAADSSLVKIYDGVRLVNNVKLENKRALDYIELHGEIVARSAGGAAIINFNSTIWMYGGVIDNCAVATEYTEETAEDGTVSNREYNGCGGAIYNVGNFYMYGGEITNCTSLRGGAIYNSRYIFLDAGTIGYCKAYTFGGAVSSNSSANADNHFGNANGNTKMRFIGNHAVRAGGAFYSNTNSPLVINRNTEFVDNHSDTSGGAIYTGGALTIRGAYFSGNYCTYSGGAIYHHFANADRARRLLSIEDSVFENNTASLGGAVILSSNVAEAGTYATIENCSFIGNHALKNEHNAGNGGALYITRYSEAIVTGCTFTKNEATTNAGGVAVHSNSKLTMSGCRFVENTAQFGGGMYVSSNAQATLTDIEYVGNEAVLNENGGGGNGGALYLSAVKVSLKDVSLLDNSAGNNAGAIYLQNIDLVLDSSITIEGNSAGNHGGAMYLTYITKEDGTKDGSHVEIHDTTLRNNTALAGGAISARSASELILKNVGFVGNSTPDAKVSTENGGGAIYSNNSTIKAEKVTFDSNMSGYYGGALRLVSCESTFNDCVFDKNTGGTGGVLYVPGGSLSLTNCKIRDNVSSLNGILYVTAQKATLKNVTANGNNAVYGGVLYTNANTVATVENCYWFGNSASSGGALYVAGNSSVTVTDSDFENNNASSQGGAVYVIGTKIQVSGDTTFTGNSAASNGGAISALDELNETTGEKKGATVTITDATFTDNTGACGGAVYFNDSTYLISDSQFVGNTATSTSYGGGAVYNTGANGSMERVVLYDNTALRGGAVALYTNSSMSVSDVQAIGNVASADGGAFYVNKCQLQLLGDSIILNENTANNGGALYLHNTGMDLTNVTLQGNTALNNGGAVYIVGKTLNITGVQTRINGNSAANYGGVIYGTYVTDPEGVKIGSTINITGVTVNDNSALYGGAIAGRTNTSINLTDVVLKDNNTDLATLKNEAGGGAIFANNSVLTISGCEFTGNSSGYYGGGIKTDACEVILKDGTRFEGNSGGTGAVLYLSTGSSLNATDLEVVNNTSSTNGILYLNGNDFVFDNLTATGNSAVWNGGVLYTNGGKTNVTVTNSLLKGNTSASGGAVYVGNGQLTLRDSRIEDNSATNGGAIYATAGTVTLDGCAVTGNTATKQGGVICSIGANINLVGGEFKSNTAVSGGAVYAEKAELIVDGTIFTENTATSGGAICVSGAILNIIGDAVFTENSSTGNGGAIWAGKLTYKENEEDTESITVIASVNVNGAVFSKNTGLRGGAVYVSESQYTFMNTQFVDNTATDLSYGGGAVYSTASTGEMEGVTLTGNTSVKGGAVAMHTNSALTVNSLIATGNSAAVNANGEFGIGGVFYVNNSTLNLNGTDGSVVIGTAESANSSAGGGSAIRAENNASVSVSGAVITGNSASSGTVYAQNSKFTVNNTVFSNNAVSNNGGAVYVTGGTLVSENNTFAGNSANHGGAIYVTGCETTLNGNTFTENTAINNGGAIYLIACSVNGENNTFTDNAASGHGGAIYVNYTKQTVEEQTTNIPGVLTLTGGSFQGNTAMAGGAVSIRSHSTASFNGTVFSGNSVAGYAGDNDGDGDGGGVIYVGFGTVNMTNVTATGNSAESYGGVVDSYYGTVTITGGTYENNTAAIGGGVIYGAEGDTVTIQNAVFTGNKTTDKTVQNTIGGGVIQIVKGELSISGATFTGNSSGYYGGAVLASGSQVTINGNTTITGSAGSTGAALYFKDSCTVVVENVQITGNTAKGNGVVYANSGSLNFKNVTATDNKSLNGGVFYTSGSTKITLEGSEFTSNTATNAGGVVYLAGGTLTVTDCTMTENTAGLGGVIYNKGTAQVTGTAFNENSATGELGGGAIAIDGGSVKLSTGTSFTGNTATVDGGAIYATSTDPDKLIVELNGVVFTDNSAVRGGAIYDEGASVTVNGTEFTDNSASSGGAVMLVNDATVELTGATFTGNIADYGGAVNVSGANVMILDGTTFTGNTSTVNGGAVWVGNYTYKENEEDTESVTVKSNLAVDGAAFTGNTAAQGGAIYVTGNTYTVKNTQFINNSAISKTHGGGAVYTTGSVGQMENVTLTGNTSHRGGAVALHTSSVLTVTSMTATGNSATLTEEGTLGVGGAFFVGGATLNLNGTDCSIVIGTAESGNTAANNGGAIIVENNAVLNISGAVFTGNTAANNGGAVYTYECDFTVNNTSFTGNTAGTHGGAIYLTGCEVTGEGNTFIDNTAGEHGGAIYVSYTGSGDSLAAGVLTLTGGSFQGNTAIAGGAVSIRSHSTANFTETSFTGNSVTGYMGENDGDGDGGGVFYVGYGTLNLTNVTATGNTAETFGGVIDAAGATVNVTGVTFSGNSAECGGVIYGISGSKVTFTGATLKENTSTYDVAVSGYDNSMGGGAINMYTGTLTLDGAVLDGNTTGYYGGAVLANKVTVTIQNNTEIKNNTGGTGAALLFKGGCKVTMEGGSITDNTATANGVIYANATTMTMTGVTATGNSANSGGVLFVSGSSSVVNVENCIFSSNSAKNGGAISIDGGACVNVNGGTQDQNTATNLGGAIYVADSSTTNDAATKLTMVGVTLSGNSATKKGGAVATDTSSLNLIIDASNCIFTGNTSGEGGGAVEIQNGNCASTDDPTEVKLVFTNSTFTDNEAGSTGGAIEIRTSSCAKFDGITATGNTAKSNGGVIYVTSNFSRVYLTGTVTVSGNTASSGNFMYLYNNNYTNPPKLYTTHSNTAAWYADVKGNRTNVVFDLVMLP